MTTATVIADGVQFEEVMVPMRDGVSLRTGIYLSDEAPTSARGVVLVRTRYWGYSPFQQEMQDGLGSFFVHRGYGVVVQSVRGLYGSEGTYAQYRGEIEDGRDTTEWIASQPWSNGRIATYGGSYLGYTALAAAADNPAVKVVILDDAPIDGNYSRRFSGIPNLSTLSWLNRLGKESSEVSSWGLFVAQQVLRVETADQVALGHQHPEWQAWVAHPSPEDPYWTSLSLRTVVNHVCAPVLSIKSNENWSDPDLIWLALQDNPCADHGDQRLLVTADPHGAHTGLIFLPEVEGMPEHELIVDYIDKFLGEQAIDLGDVPLVQFRAPSDPRVYRSAPGWPPAATGWSLYFSGWGWPWAGTLQPSRRGFELPTWLHVDPERSYCAEYPFAVFASEPLTEAVYVAGFPAVELYASATTVDADFTATLHEVAAGIDPSQVFQSSVLQSTLVAHGGLRARYRRGLTQEVPLIPGGRERLILIMDGLVHEFRPGNRIVVTLGASRCHAVDQLLQFENPHTGEPLGHQTRWLPSDYLLFHDGQAASRIVLPVLQE